MKLPEAASLWAGRDPAVVFVPPRVLRRVVKREKSLAGFGRHVPHTRCFSLERDALAGTVTEAEIRARFVELPRDVILVPDTARANARNLAVERAWRDVFHARVHVEFGRLVEAGRFSESAARERVHRIGQTEFDEIRLVLRHEDLLLPSDGVLAAYVEFVALFLELAYFAPESLPRYFPSLDADDEVHAVVSADIDPGAIVSSSCPAGWHERAVALGRRAGAEAGAGAGAVAGDESLRLCASARGSDLAQSRKGAKDAGAGAGDEDRARAKARAKARAAGAEAGAVAEAEAEAEAEAGAGAGAGAVAEAEAAGTNVVRAALEAARTGESPAPAIAALVARLGEAIGPLPRASWDSQLRALAVRAAAKAPRNPARTVEARLLFDLQKACVDHERALFSADLVRFITTLGRAKVVRPLPAAQRIRVARHLQAALKKSSRLDLHDGDAHALRRLLHDAIERADHRAREALAPRLAAVLDEVGLIPSNIPETVARKKLVNDLLDVALARGHLTLGNLRDAVSRSDLKLPNLAGARAFFCGDPLLRADARLADELDGVYRRGEIYLRGLQKLSSLGFGTVTGRLLNLYALLPVVAAYIVLEGLQHIVGPIVHKLSGVQPHILNPISFALTALFVFGLLHSAAIRRATVAAFKGLGASLKFIFYSGPRWVLTRPTIRRVLGSVPARLVGRYVVKPGLLTLIAAPIGFAFALPLDVMIPIDAAVFVLIVAFLSSPLGREIDEIVSDATRRAARQVRHQILPGVVRLIIDFFSVLLGAIEHLLYVVDEWLRFRAGDRRSLVPLRAALGLVWFFLTYLIRIYVNLLIEPQVNPIKHFPVVTVSHKIILPMTPTLIEVFRTPFMPFGAAFANAVGAATVVLLPGMFGFLAWELKENWRLYRANRARDLRAVVVGSHGESMAQLLRLGFHSGTIPKAFVKLRRAAAKGGRDVARREEALHHAEEAVRRFVERELVAFVAEVGDMTVGPLKVGRIALGSNRVRVHLQCAGTLGAEDAEALLAFEEQSGFIIGTIAQPGFLARLSPKERQLFDAVLAGFFRKAAVDYTREAVEAALAGAFKTGSSVPPYDFCDAGLVVWPGQGFATELLYDLRSPVTARGVLSGPPLREGPPAIDVTGLSLKSTPIAWSEWIECWG